MGGVRADEAFAAGRREGPEVAADIAGGHAVAAQGGDHQVREVLADAAALREDAATGVDTSVDSGS